MSNDYLDSVVKNEADRLAEQVRNTITKYYENARIATDYANVMRESVRDAVIDEYKKENKELRDRLKLSVATLYSDEELSRYEAFVKTHTSCRANGPSDSGRKPYVIQTAHGIGVSTRAFCPICGASADITDTSAW